MFRLFINIIVIAVGVIVVFNFLPAGTKEKVLALLSSLIPNIVEEKIQEKIEPIIDPIIYSPVERREKLLTQLKNDVAEIKAELIERPKEQLGTVEEIVKKIEESEKIIEKIQDANEEQGIINKVTTTVIQKATEIISPGEKQSEAPYVIQQQTPPQNSCRWVCD